MVGAHIDITDRKRYEQTLKEQNERLEEFTRIVSHDLRNPVNVAKGHLELAQADCESEQLDAIGRALDRMETLIEDLLTLTREEDHVADPKPVDLAHVAEACWRSVATNEATLNVRTEQRIRADPRRLRQLLENLFRNAVEHGGSDVTVTIDEITDGFAVADDGVGIPDAARDQVFTSGYSTSSEGNGLGLRIVKQAVEAHGWEITLAESDAGGARFEITGVRSAEYV